MNLEKILIVGAGNGGQAATVDLTSAGFDVCLYEFPEFSEKLREKITSKIIRSKGFIEGDIKIDLITTNEQEAAEYSKVVLVTMPAYGHQKFFSTFRGKLQEGSNVYFFPGNLCSLENFELSEKGITLVEFNSLPYGCRVDNEGVVNLLIKTSLLTYSAFPAKDTFKVTDEIKQLFPGNKKDLDILAVSLNNPNPLIHPPGVLFNLGRIEFAQGDFYMYNEGMTESTLRLIDAVNTERIRIGEELGYDLINLDGFKGSLPDGTVNSFINCGVYANMLGPCDRNNRYLTEDVPFGLGYWSEIGHKLNVLTPNIDAILTLTSTVCDHYPDNKLLDVVKKLPVNRNDLRRFLYEGKI